tara:strand:- start:9596 stop:9883 length:288 start_codon:yes stop_codon:yes gene_type:complete
MFLTGTATINNVTVKTSNNGGLSTQDLAEICADKIISVSETADPAIREQALFFKNNVKNLLEYWINQAKQSEKDRCMQILLQGGYEEAANILRRL